MSCTALFPSGGNKSWGNLEAIQLDDLPHAVTAIDPGPDEAHCETNPEKSCIVAYSFAL
jgi:hypothetical protein